MGVNSPLSEPEFDLNSSFVPVNISEFLKEISVITDVSERAMKMDDYVLQLQDELNKVHAFKRELPLCMLLLNDAIERLKEEKMKCGEIETGPLIEEFMTLKGGKSDENGGVIKSIDCSEKKNWMSSVQLWSTNVQFHNFGHDFLSNLKSKVREEDGSRSSGGYDETRDKLQSSGGAFVPFKRQSGQIVKEKIDNLLKEKNKTLPVNNLSLRVPMVEIGSIDRNSKGNVRGTSRSDSALPERKRRRCWSPELHRRFVNALQQLGGPHVATPKQIREVMQVNDLTNDEVKSHLQKYRLHVRKVPAAKLNCPWFGQDQHISMSNSSISQSGSPEGPLGCGKGVSTTGGDSMEEEEKSEGRNWKGSSN
ncbi:transcription factor HHO5 isoform X1 [Daucus carota subsp. sativus]|uniref:transcription factor HHO5 isoform X1 n=1 Tax=Daucus carota subsp. sativus TaxID=79200 RepID=UPI0007B22B45|nr:PREDICTED: uncharacterized protein LOC108214423 isoform X1 [Daucus carota subsp. sativus]